MTLRNRAGPREQKILLRHVGNAPGQRYAVGCYHQPGGRSFQPGDNAQQRGFTHAARPQQRRGFSRRDLKAQVLENRHPGVVQGEVFDKDTRRRVHLQVLISTA